MRSGISKTYTPLKLENDRRLGCEEILALWRRRPTEHGGKATPTVGPRAETHRDVFSNSPN